MITYSNIKAYNQIWSPMGRYPMIDNTIFETYAEALAFATTNAVAVVGNIVAVTSDEDASKNGAYILICDGELTSASQPTGLKKIGSDIDLSNYVTKDQISSVYTYKGSKATFAELPVVDVAVGDVWNVEEAYENHPAGTNWVWDGENWDALAGSVDLSGYALKADVEASVKTLTEGVAANTGAINTINSALDNKVEKVEGSSLITAEKLALIDTNAADIQALEDKELDSRVSTLEGMFKDGETNINLSGINAAVTDHSSRIGVLEADTAINKTNIGNLQTQANGYGERLVAIENLNTEQSNLIGGLTTRVETVEAYGTSITSLTTTVNGHTESISTLTTGVSEAKALAAEEAKKAEAAAKKHAEDKIAELSFDEAGTAKTLADAAEANAKSYADGKFQVIGNYEIAGTAADLNDAMDVRVKKLEAIDHNKLVSDAAASAVATIVDDAPEAFDTLKEIADWLLEHPNDVLAIQNRIKTIEDDYLTSADKTAIEQIITDNERVTAEALTDLDSRVDELEAQKTVVESALQAADIATGSANGTIAVKGVDVAVKGLGSAAYTASTAYATAAQGAKADTAAPQATTYTKDEVNALLEWEEVE